MAIGDISTYEQELEKELQDAKGLLLPRSRGQGRIRAPDDAPKDVPEDLDGPTALEDELADSTYMGQDDNDDFDLDA